jgi:phytoene synthase
VREAAAALGTVRLLLDLPRHLARGRVPLPRSWLQGLDADVAAFAAPENEAARTRALAAARAFAAERLAAARRAATGLPRRCLAAFLPLALIEPQLRALTRREHDPLHDLATIAPVVRVWRLWLAHARGRF